MVLEDGVDDGIHGGCTDDVSQCVSRFTAYYRNDAIRDRIAEFLGGCHSHSSTAYLVATDGTGSGDGNPASVGRLAECLAAGLEISRSLWDRDCLIADLDLEYHNFDNPAAAWEDPERCFRLQRPVFNATLRILGDAGINPLTLVSGRGFHLVWAVRRDSRAFRRLAQMGTVPPDLEARYAHARSPGGFQIDPRLGRAFAGLGKLMEFVFQRVSQVSRAACEIPLQPAAIEVGPSTHGREIVSFDLSEYGDPLHSRYMRVPFSVYLKPRQLKWALGEEGVERLLPIFAIPLDGMNPLEAIRMARDPEAVLKLGGRTCMRIPEARGSMENLLDEYQSSALGAFHADFEKETRDKIDAPVEPIRPCVPCLDWPLTHPNDWLLRPAAIQHVTRVLTAQDWAPASIASLIANRYLTDDHWGDTWLRLEPWNRAIFYTRLFAGMIATGTDELIDMNCVSHKEKGYCMVSECSSNLSVIRDVLAEKRSA